MERFRLRGLLLVALAGLLLTACDEDPQGPELGPQDISVMTRNLYVGAEITDLLLVTDPLAVPDSVASMWAAVQATDFTERAEALAAEIESAMPDVIGLQEVSLFRYQTPGDKALGGTVPAETVVLDFLDVLMDALEDLGLNYTVAAQVTDFDLEVPIEAGGLWPDDIRLTDHDVILVRGGVGVLDTDSGNYSLNLTTVFAGIDTITVTRGWVSADLWFPNGKVFRFVNTHLEPATIGGMPVPELIALQEAQAAELRSVLNTSNLPLIVVGDLNSPADGSLTQTYNSMLNWGLSDLWTSVLSGVGYTCCQNADLLNPTSVLDERIDLILFTNPFSAESVDIVGEETGDMTTVTGLWPSDHAGVWGVVRY